ncbi:MAG: hypothetical protein J5612_00995 [Paludibacteraceae bacterium]|nr:hypothetical protein [Paludibacteraceae bacterium]
MKKSVKITLWVVGIIAGIFILFETCADVAVSRIAEKKAHAAIEAAELPFTVDFNRIHVFIMAGSVEVTDIRFAANGKQLNTKEIDTVDVTLPDLSIRGINYFDLLRNKRVSVNSVKVHKLSALYKEKKSKMSVQVDSLTVTVHDLFYSLKDSTYGYNDSIYSLKFKHLAFVEPQGLLGIEANDFKTKNAGPIQLGRTKIAHRMDKRKLGDIVKKPVSWLSMSLNSVEIAPMNILRYEQFLKGVHLSKITVNGDKLETLRDVRYKPTEPFPMPQQAIMQLKFPIAIDQVDVTMKTIDVNVLMTDKNCGEMHVNKLKATVRDFSNKKNSVMKVDLTACLGDAQANALFKMYMNNDCRFDVEMYGKNLETKHLNKLIRPLTSMELDCTVDSLRAKYTGDKVKAGGTVMLAYHGLRGKVHKGDEIPFKIISQNAGALEYFVNNLIPKSNPRNESKEPLSFNVEWEKKPEQAFGMYMVGPLIMGAVQTFLPGLFQGKKVK